LEIESKNLLLGIKINMMAKIPYLQEFD